MSVFKRQNGKMLFPLRVTHEAGSPHWNVVNAEGREQFRITAVDRTRADRLREVIDLANEGWIARIENTHPDNR
jgi:phosphoketolase